MIVMKAAIKEDNEQIGRFGKEYYLILFGGNFKIWRCSFCSGNKLTLKSDY